MFVDRVDAGVQLARALSAHVGPHAVIVALPRGGVPLAAEIALRLRLPLDIRMPHKVGAPSNAELAIGALTEQGELLYDPALLEQLGIGPGLLARLRDEAWQRLQTRMNLLRGDLPRQSLEGRVVVIVDDGLATGSTMLAAIETVRAEGPARVVVAVPVGSREAVERVSERADAVFCLEQPDDFSYVGQFYRRFE